MESNAELNIRVVINIRGKLFVTMNNQGKNNLRAGDLSIKNHLENRGFNVITREDTIVKSEDALGKDLVVLSESARSREVGLFLFRDTANAFTPEGWSLFDSAVDWSISKTETVLKSEVQTKDK